MGGGIVMLLIGFLAGGAAASAVWAVIVLGKRRADDARKAERDQLMASIGETLAEADAIETNFRSGAMTAEAFRHGLCDRVNAVMRQLRTNMHALDSFFVKYAEHEAREYLRVIDNPERRKQGDGPELPAASPMPDSDADAAGAELPEPPETDLFSIVTASAPAPSETAESDGGASEEHEQPPAAPAPIPDAAESADDFEPPPAPEVSGASEEHEPPAAPAPISSVAESVDDFEPPPAAAPAPIAADAADDFEPPFAPPAADVVDIGNRHVQPPAAPPPAPAPIAANVDAADNFEPPPAHVNEEELVLGESPEDTGAAFAHHGPAPAPQGAETFAPPPHPAPIAPASEPAWGDGESIEEDFEAAFAQFETPAPPPPAAARDMLTETNSIDKGAVQSATPPQTPQQSDPQGITGDDVADSIDNFFNLK